MKKMGEELTLKEILKAREKSYGDFSSNSLVARRLIESLELSSKYRSLPAVHLTGLNMICHKIARLVCGDCNHIDTLTDIIGYVELIKRHSVGDNKKESPGKSIQDVSTHEAA